MSCRLVRWGRVKAVLQQSISGFLTLQAQTYCLRRILTLYTENLILFLLRNVKGYPMVLQSIAMNFSQDVFQKNPFYLVYFPATERYPSYLVSVLDDNSSSLEKKKSLTY